jgi:uncharacterized protein (TIRG00374 family)
MRRTLYWTLTLLLAGTLLYFSFRGIDWREVWRIASGANLATMGAVTAIISFSMLLRALRWRVLLVSEGPVDVPLAFSATSVGYLGNNLLPARAGELVRSLVISRRAGLSPAFVLTTAFSERVIDALVLMSVSAGVLLTLSRQPGWFGAAARPIAVAGLAGVAIIGLAPLFERFWCRMLDRLPAPQALRERARAVLGQALQAFRCLHSGRRLAHFLALTAVIWALDGLTTVVGARAIGVQIGFPLAFLLVAALGLASALPSTPGYVGIYQYVAVTVLVPFGLSRADSIAYILLFQALTYVVVLFWGFLGLRKQRDIVMEGRRTTGESGLVPL